MGVYQRGNQYWIEFRYKGNRYREAVGPDEKLAEDVLSKRRVEIRENKFFPGKQKEMPQVRFHSFAKDYLKWAKVNKKASTCVREISIMRILERHFGESKFIHEITPSDIEDLKSKMSKTCKPASINRALCLVKHMFSTAVKWEKLRESPAKDVKRLKGETKRVRYLMPDEIQTLLLNCDGLLRGYLKSLVTVAVHTGARKGELQNLKWPQVNSDLGIITLLDTKNGERRDIPMNETVKATLEALEKKSEFVFPNRKGQRRIDDAQIQLAFAEALRRAEITDFHFHDLRHTFASNLVMQGVDLNTVRDLLGHKDLKMTLRYAHLSPEHRNKVVSILDKLMERAVPQKRPQVAKLVNLRS